MKQHKSATDIKVGVIGYGLTFKMGKIHLEKMMQAGMTPVCITDTALECVKEAKQDFPDLEIYSSVASMLKKSDVSLLVIITPHNNHAVLANQCLKAGKHVIVEKPMAITTDECTSMIETAKRNKKLLSVFHNRHWDSCIVRAVKKIQPGIIGDVLHIKIIMGIWGDPGEWWRSSKTISGGVLYDWGVHLLEYGLQIIRNEITEVNGFMNAGFWKNINIWKKDTIEDEGLAMVRFKNNKWLSLCITNIDSREHPYFMEITGTEGTYQFNHQKWEVIKRKKNNTTTITKGNNSPNESWEKYYKNIANHLVTGERLVITAEYARKLVHILELAEKSSKEGRSLKPKY